MEEKTQTQIATEAAEAEVELRLQRARFYETLPGPELRERRGHGFTRTAPITEVREKAKELVEAATCRVEAPDWSQEPTSWCGVCRLEQLVEFLGEVPQSNHNQSWFANGPMSKFWNKIFPRKGKLYRKNSQGEFVELDPECGTSACACGWGGVRFRHMGRGKPKPYSVTWSEGAVTGFGLDGWLFHGGDGKPLGAIGVHTDFFPVMHYEEAGVTDPPFGATPMSIPEKQRDLRKIIDYERRQGACKHHHWKESELIPR